MTKSQDDDMAMVRAIIQAVLDGLGLSNRRRAVRLYVRVGPVEVKQPGDIPSPTATHQMTGRGDFMTILKADEKVKLGPIAPVDRAGNPAAIDGVPTWSVGDPAIIGLDVAADGLSAYAIAAGPVGLSQVNITADADLGEGVTTISGTVDFQVVAAQAVGLAIPVGTPEPQVPA